jgi:hypothetical protein
MPYRAIRIDEDPLKYFLQEHTSDSQFLQVADIVLRENKDPREIFAHMIRIATGSKWSHSAIISLLSDPYKGFNNTFLVEATTKGIRIASWRNEVVPFEKFTVGIKRPRLDWYIETEYERSRHDPTDPEDTHGIGYLRHVRGIAIDQLSGLYDKKTVLELTALFARRVAKRRLHAIPQAAEAADALANLFKKEDEDEYDMTNMLRFVCSGLVQYSFFEALRRRIMNAFDIPAHREVAEQNLQNMHRVVFREDPEGIIDDYIQRVQIGKLDIHDPAPEEVLDLLKTALPADFNDSPNLEWRYVVLKGVVWRIEETTAEYQPQSDDEKEILGLLAAEKSSAQ